MEEKRTMNQGLVLALVLAGIMLLAVVIGCTFRRLYDEQMNKSQPSNVVYDTPMNGAGANDCAPIGGGANKEDRTTYDTPLNGTAANGYAPISGGANK